MVKKKLKKRTFIYCITIAAILLLFIGLGIHKGNIKDDYNKNKDINVGNPIEKHSEGISGNKLNNANEENKNDEAAKSTNNDKKEQQAEKKDESSKDKNTEKLTSKQAEQIINEYVGTNNSKIESKYDHNDNRAGIDYYVIQVYEKMEDHVATIGWYYVNTNTGEAYEWDLINDKLISLSKVNK